MNWITSTEILIYYSQFKNIDLFQQGLYRIRASIKNAQPYMLLEQLGIGKRITNSRLQSSEISGNTYLSCQFWIRYEDEEFDLKDGCIFRLDRNYNCQDGCTILLELFFCDTRIAEQVNDSSQIPMNKLTEFQIGVRDIRKINSLYMPVDFNQSYACQISTLIYTCPLNIKHIYSEQQDNSVEIVEYLQDILRLLTTLYKDNLKQYISDPQCFQQYLGVLKDTNTANIQANNSQLILNIISTSLYTIWYNYLEFLPSIETKLMANLLKQYYDNIGMHYNDFIIVAQPKQTRLIIRQKPFIDSIRETTNRNLYLLPIQQLFTSDYPILTIEGQHQSGPQITQLRHLIVFVHGYKGSPYDMRRWRNAIKVRHPEILTLMSCCNQRESADSIEMMGKKLSIEIQQHIQEIGKVDRISFICHSIGGIVVRAALPHLYTLRNCLYFYLTLGSPHLGMLLKQTTLVKTGFWMMTRVIQSQSMVQLALKDSQDVSQSFLIKLSQQNTLEWFKKVVLVGSSQDDYIPYESARIEESVRMPNNKAVLHQDMLNNIRLPVTSRIDVNFKMESNWDTFIGRAAHMGLVENMLMIKMIIASGNFIY